MMANVVLFNYFKDDLFVIWMDRKLVETCKFACRPVANKFFFFK